MDYDGYGAGELMVDRSNDQSTLGQAVGVDAFCTGMGRLVERAMTEEFFRHFGEYVKGARLPLLLLLARVLLLHLLPHCYCRHYCYFYYYYVSLVPRQPRLLVPATTTLPLVLLRTNPPPR